MNLLVIFAIWLLSGAASTAITIKWIEYYDGIPAEDIHPRFIILPFIFGTVGLLLWIPLILIAEYRRRSL